MKTIESYNVTCEFDHEQYWQGHGIAFTNYDECATGNGSSPREALGDCLDSLAQNDIRFADDQENELIAALETQCEDIDKVETTEDCWFYVSIDVKFKEGEI